MKNVYEKSMIELTEELNELLKERGSKKVTLATFRSLLKQIGLVNGEYKGRQVRLDTFKVDYTSYDNVYKMIVRFDNEPFYMDNNCKFELCWNWKEARYVFNLNRYNSESNTHRSIANMLKHSDRIVNRDYSVKLENGSKRLYDLKQAKWSIDYYEREITRAEEIIKAQLDGIKRYQERLVEEKMRKDKLLNRG